MSLIKRLLLLTCLLVLVGLHPVVQAQQDLFQQGMSYLNVGFYDQAVTAFAQLLHREPENAAAHCQLGAAYRLQDRLSDAISAYENALTLGASADIYGTAHLCLAMIHQEEGVFDKAKLYALEAVELLPQTAKAYLTLGKIDLYYRADEEAKANLLQAIQIDPDLTEAYQLLGQHAVSKKQPEKALAYLKTALDLDPYQSATYYHLAAAYRSTRQFEMVRQSLQAFQESKAYQADVHRHQKHLQQEPQDLKARLSLAETYLEYKNFVEAEDEYKTILKIAPDTVLAYDGLAAIHMQQSDYAQAESVFKQMLQIDPNLASAHINLGWLASQQGNLETAKSHLKQAIRLNETLATAYQGLAEIQVQEKDLAAAISTYHRLLDHHPDHEGVRLRLGILYATQGQANEAIRFFQRVLVVNEDNAEACKNLAWLYAEQKIHLDQAVTLAEKAVELQPFPSHYDTLAYVYYHSQQYQKAEEAIQKALSLAPNTPEYQSRQQQIKERIETD